MPDSFRNLALFRIFAARATAELLCQGVEAELRDREEKLRSVFEGAMDAMVDLYQDVRIIMMNPSARRMIAESNEAVGKTFEPSLEKKDFRRLIRLVRKLEKHPSSERNVCIPDGLIAVNSQPVIVRSASLNNLNISVIHRMEFKAWDHPIRVENILAQEGCQAYPACIGGKRACPLENWDGPLRFMALVEHYSLLSYNGTAVK